MNDAPAWGVTPTGGCALASLRGEEETVGTATPFDDLFLLQFPPPWARLALDTPGVPAGLRQALVPAARAGRRAYVLLVHADDTPPPAEGWSRILHVRTVGDASRRLERNEYVVRSEALVEAVEALADGRSPAVAPAARPLPDRDLLVCTHGERDGCCGAFGEAAYRYLRDRHAGPGLRVWRVSHFGGHRFAPTLVDLPEGRCWGRLSTEAMDGIVGRHVPPSGLTACYRGSCRLPSIVQTVERDLFVEHGWSWLDAEWTLSLEPGGSPVLREVSARYRLPGGPWRSRRAIVRPLPAVEVPASCGAEEGPIVHYVSSWQDRAVSSAG